jgi:predicted metal-dependent hydrolase
VSYVKLKHTLAAIALDAIEHPDRVPLANALRVYAERSGDGDRVPVTSIARATGLAPDEARRMLVGTGLFEGSSDRDAGRITLAAPFRPFAAYLRRQTARTAAAVRLLAAPRRAEIPEEIWRAAALFNAGLFFECHEYLEDVWRATPGSERAFYHGLVQAAAGCYHLEKGNAHGARTLIQKAVAKLEPYAPAYREVAVTAFLAELRRVLRWLDRVPRARGQMPLPTLELVGSPRQRRVRGGNPSAGLESPS